MSDHVIALYKVASDLSSKDPLLAYELENQINLLVATTPYIKYQSHLKGIRSLHESVEESQKKLQFIKNAITKTLSQYKGLDAETAKDFADALGDKADPQVEILKTFLERAEADLYNLESKVASSRIALFDFKKWFKKKDEEAVKPLNRPVTEKDVESFIEKGTPLPEDKGLNKEFQYQKKYWKLVNDAVNAYFEYSKKPNKDDFETLESAVEYALNMGKNILQGTTFEPGSEESPIELGEQALETVEPKKPVVPPVPSAKRVDEIKKSMQDCLLRSPKSQGYRARLRNLYDLLKMEFIGADMEGVFKTSSIVVSFAKNNPRIANDLYSVLKKAMA